VCNTDDSRRGYDKSDIHLSIGGPQPFEVPERKLGQYSGRRHEEVPGRISTNKFDGDGLRVEKVRPCCIKASSGRENGGRGERKRGGPSKMTPKEPSPIFLPTR
jgi:hypothetical protein